STSSILQTRSDRNWSPDVCSSDLGTTIPHQVGVANAGPARRAAAVSPGGKNSRKIGTWNEAAHRIAAKIQDFQRYDAGRRDIEQVGRGECREGRRGAS